MIIGLTPCSVAKHSLVTSSCTFSYSVCFFRVAAQGLVTCSSYKEIDQGFQLPSAMKQQQQQQQQHDAADCLTPRRWSLSASNDCWGPSQQLLAVHLASSCSKQGKDQAAAAAGSGYTVSLHCWGGNRSSSAASFDFKPKKQVAAASGTYSVSTSTCSSSSCYKAQSIACSSSFKTSSCKARSIATTIASSSSSPTSSSCYKGTAISSSSSSLQPHFSERDLAVLKKLQNGRLAAETLEAALGHLDSLVQDTERSTVLGCGSYGE
jgi:hypothetical protein